MANADFVGCGRDVGWAVRESYFITFDNGNNWLLHSGATVNDGERLCGSKVISSHQRLCTDCARKYGIEW